MHHLNDSTDDATNDPPKMNCTDDATDDPPKMTKEVTVVMVETVETREEVEEMVVREGRGRLIEEQEETVEVVGMVELTVGEEDMEVLAVWEVTIEVKEVVEGKVEGVELLADPLGVVALVVKGALVVEVGAREEAAAVVVAPQFVNRATSLAQSLALVDQEGLVGPVDYVRMGGEKEESGVTGVLADCFRRAVVVDRVGPESRGDVTGVTDRMVSQDY